jgi:hypothetical protein
MKKLILRNATEKTMVQQNINQCDDVVDKTIRNYTPAQKWEQAVKLRQLAWDMKFAFVRSNHPQWSEEELRKVVKEIFLNATT